MRSKWDTGKTEKKRRQEGKGHKIKKESLFRGNSSQASERKGMSIFGVGTIAIVKWEQTFPDEESWDPVGGMGPCGHPCQHYGPYSTQGKRRVSSWWVPA